MEIDLSPFPGVQHLHGNLSQWLHDILRGGKEERKDKNNFIVIIKYLQRWSWYQHEVQTLAVLDGQ